LGESDGRIAYEPSWHDASVTRRTPRPLPLTAIQALPAPARPERRLPQPAAGRARRGAAGRQPGQRPLAVVVLVRSAREAAPGHGPVARVLEAGARERARRTARDRSGGPRSAVPDVQLEVHAWGSSEGLGSCARINAELCREPGRPARLALQPPYNPPRYANASVGVSSRTT
jgi:hypothetical protein